MAYATNSPSNQYASVLEIANTINNNIKCEFGGSFGLAMKGLLNRKVNDLDIFIENEDISYFVNQVENYKTFYDYLGEDSKDVSKTDKTRQEIENELDIKYGKHRIRFVYKQPLFYQFVIDGVKIDVWINHPQDSVAEGVQAFGKWYCFNLRSHHEAYIAKTDYIRSFINKPNADKSKIIKHVEDLNFYFNTVLKNNR